MKNLNEVTLKVGRELDALVAEKVMGWTNITDDFWGCPVRNRASMVPIHKYSTNITAAWEVVSKLKSLEFFIGIDETIPLSGLSYCVVRRYDK